MRQVLGIAGSGWFLLSIIFIMGSIYSVNSFIKELPPQELLLKLFDNIPFEVSYFLFIIGLFLRALKHIIDERSKKIGAILIIIGLIILLLSSYLSIRTRSVMDIKARTGDSTAYGLISRINSDMPDRILIIGKEIPKRPGRVEVEILSKERIERIGLYPFSIIGKKALFISDLNISPSIEVSYKEERLRADYLSLYPPKGETRVRFPGGQYTLFISLYPERSYKKGRLDVNEYNISSPIYRIVIKDGNRTIFEGLLKDNDQRSEGKISVSLRRSGEWVNIRSVEDIFLFPMYVGIMVLLTGFMIIIVKAIRSLIG
jgi:hypothetical protein